MKRERPKALPLAPAAALFSFFGLFCDGVASALEPGRGQTQLAQHPVAATLPEQTGSQTAPGALGRFEQPAAAGQPAALRWSSPHGIVAVNPPETAIGSKLLAITVQSQAVTDNQATFHYQVQLPNDPTVLAYEVELSLCSAPGGPLLRCRSVLSSEQPLKQDLCITQQFNVPDRMASALIAEKCRANVGEGGLEVCTEGMRAWRINREALASAYFELGKETTDRRGAVLSMPVVSLAFGGAGTPVPRMLSVGVDPYCGVQFHAGHFQTGENVDTRLSVVTRYHGALVPVRNETRTMALQFHDDGIDGMVRSFYATIPEIKPGPAWIRDVAMNFYDYFGDDGKGWYQNVDKLAQIVPKEHRGKVVCCVHGWYDRIGDYCFDPKTGKLADEWKVFGRSSNNKPEMHRRIAFARERGFRVILYFADGLNSTEFHEGMVFLDEHGRKRTGWMGPDGGGPFRDAANPAVRAWYRAYLEALLKEYGKDIDGFVFDETNHMHVGDVSTGGREPAYADRGMMALVSELAQTVQDRWKMNPDLVFLEGSHYYYGLVAHGSYTDYPGLPLMINYRNASWQCCWEGPGVRNLHCHSRTDPKIDYPYGLDIGLTDGWGSRLGPAKMPQQTLDEVMERFLKRVQEGPPKPKIKIIDDPDGLL